MNAFIRKWWPVAVAAVFLGTPVALAQVGRGVGVGGRFGVPDPLTLSRVGAESTIQKVQAGDLGIGPTSANSVLGLYAGSAGGVRTKYGSVTLNGLTLGNSAHIIDGGVSLGWNVTGYGSGASNLTTTDAIVKCNAASGAATLTLPAATTTGREIDVIKSDTTTNTCTIQRGGADSIGGAASVVLDQAEQQIRLVADGSTTWFPIGVPVGATATLAPVMHPVGLLTLVNQHTTVGAATVDLDTFTWPASAARVPAARVSCILSADVAGSGAGSCSYSLRNVTGSANICTISGTCSTFSAGVGACTSSADLIPGTTYGIEVTAPAANTAFNGSLICSYTY